MENSKSAQFDPRAFTVLMMVACIAALPLTGYYNHVLGFDGITVSRHAWMSAHNAVGALFVVFATWHTLLNRRALLRHARAAIGAVPCISRGALVGCALVALFLFVAIGHALHVPPRQ